jgi:hypothetical protein
LGYGFKLVEGRTCAVLPPVGQTPTGPSLSRGWLPLTRIWQRLLERKRALDTDPTAA